MIADITAWLNKNKLKLDDSRHYSMGEQNKLKDPTFVHRGLDLPLSGVAWTEPLVLGTFNSVPLKTSAK